MGWHVSMRVDHNLVLGALARLAAKGTPIPFLLSLFPDGIPVSQYRAASPLTRLAVRVWEEIDGSLHETVAQWKARVHDVNPAIWYADWYQINNEANTWTVAALQWWLDQMHWCIAHDFPILIFNWAVGNPGGDQLAIWNHPLMLQILRLIRDTRRENGMPLFLLNLHQYDLGPIATCDWLGKDDIQRWKKTVEPLLPPDLRPNVIPLCHSEDGQQAGRDLTFDQLFMKVNNSQVYSAPQTNLFGRGSWAIGNTGSQPGPNNFEGDDESNKLAVWDEVYAGNIGRNN